MENSPELFGTVIMLYISCSVNGIPVKGDLDATDPRQVDPAEETQVQVVDIPANPRPTRVHRNHQLEPAILSGEARRGEVR